LGGELDHGHTDNGGSAVFAAVAWFNQWITEIAVTNLRVIYKWGFIRRHTAEMNMGKVESVTVSQTILGRLLNYGSIPYGQKIERIEGTGTCASSA
jgi:hypothetical protein